MEPDCCQKIFDELFLVTTVALQNECHPKYADNLWRGGFCCVKAVCTEKQSIKRTQTFPYFSLRVLNT